MDERRFDNEDDQMSTLEFGNTVNSSETSPILSAFKGLRVHSQAFLGSLVVLLGNPRSFRLAASSHLLSDNFVCH